MINLPLIQSYKIFKQDNPSFGKSGLKLAAPLTKDTVSFGKKQDLLDCSEEEIFNVIDRTIKNNKNFIGEGYEALCFKIPNSEYCVRLIRDNFYDYKDYFSKDISDEDKINHVVAKLGGGSQIQKYIEGYPVEFPIGVKFDKTPEYVAGVIEEMPVSSYSNLLKQICTAFKSDMVFDCVAFNVIVNPKDKTLTAIDFYKNDEFEPDILRPLSAMYESLKNSATTYKQKKKIAGNTLLAALEEFRPHHRPCIRLQEFDFDSFISKNIQTDLIKDDNFSKLLSEKFKTLAKLKNSNTRHSDEENEKQLLWEIKVTKTLINQMYFS